MVWRVFHSIIHMAREVPSRNALCITLCRESDTTHFLREYIMSKEAFVYRWYDAPNDMYYLGKHKGSPDDTYTHSSTIWKHFTKDNIPEGVTREIIAKGTDEEMSILEHKLLKFAKENGNWDRYYNESLGDPRYVDMSGENNPMWKGGVTNDKEYQLKKKRERYWKNPEESRKKTAAKMRKLRAKWKQDPAWQEKINKQDRERRAKKKAEAQGAGTLEPYL